MLPLIAVAKFRLKKKNSEVIRVWGVGPHKNKKETKTSKTNMKSMKDKMIRY